MDESKFTAEEICILVIGFGEDSNNNNNANKTRV
jgi:hypothetical protein